ncbi:uncharacterized protein BT62DRAFT_632383 [Guyanagaster necrorhizus]|uniref:Uncharacterized protein n=1 Tax=Guyanagaster necrorhizus TaxID=856835 RepID=A0A9P8AMV4_9AGAR|nr:uncharacterized protein BT62DRAFT_632383 [Guyanagaster necrorhizus MCA 3950]KAG7440227.1 hypothetical protein BT62DRAFT_632383 [Guyanagaster necrorhizus MCA 3950]
MSLTMRLLVVVSLAGRNDHEEGIKQMYSYLVQADVKRDEGGLCAFSRHASSSTTFMIPMPPSAPDTIARIDQLDNDNLTGVSRWLVSLSKCSPVCVYSCCTHTWLTLSEECLLGRSYSLLL